MPINVFKEGDCMRITKAEQQIRKNRMLHTAYRLFCEYGINEVSLARIAEEAHVSPNSIFRYFESKTALLQKTQEILWTEIVDYITNSNQPAVDRARNGLEEIRVMLYGFESLYQNHSKYILFAYEYKAYLIRNNIKLDKNALARNTHRIRLVFLHALRRGQKEGSITTAHTASELFTLIWGVLCRAACGSWRDLRG